MAQLKDGKICHWYRRFGYDFLRRQLAMSCARSATFSSAHRDVSLSSCCLIAVTTICCDWMRARSLEWILPRLWRRSSPVGLLQSNTIPDYHRFALFGGGPLAATSARGTAPSERIFSSGPVPKQSGNVRSAVSGVETTENWLPISSFKLTLQPDWKSGPRNSNSVAAGASGRGAGKTS